MSMIQTKYCESLIKNNATPKWMRDERYDFCEPSAKKKSGLLSVIRAALSMSK